MSSNVMVCALDDLPDPGAREFAVGEGDWPLRGFVVRYQGEVRAYLNMKPDAFFAAHAPLLQCAMHGALFEPLSGRCVLGPCSGKFLQPLPVKVEDHSVWVSV